MSTFNFGKYKGQEINSVPVDYLKWLIKPKEGSFKLGQALEQEIKSVLEFKPPLGISYDELKELPNPKVEMLEKIRLLRDTLVDLEDMVKGM